MQKRKDNKNRVLKEGESQRKNGTYTYRYRTPDKVRHSVYAKTLEDLREKEKAIQTDLMNRKNYTHSSLTLDDYYKVWKDIDFENQVIHVKRTLVYYAKGKKTIHRRCYYAINKPKTEAGIRDIPILPIVEWAFTEQKKYLSDFHMISASNIDGISDFIFLNRFNEVLNGGVINKALKRIVSLINGSYKEQISPTLSCHIFRHTFLSMANAVDMNFKAKQDIVGHRCQDVTNGVYTDTEFKFRLKQMSKLQLVIDITCKHLPQAYVQIMSTYEDL